MKELIMLMDCIHSGQIFVFYNNRKIFTFFVIRSLFLKNSIHIFQTFLGTFIGVEKFRKFLI
jgi:hypothetical protein